MQTIIKSTAIPAPDSTDIFLRDEPFRPISICNMVVCLQCLVGIQHGDTIDCRVMTRHEGQLADRSVTRQMFKTKHKNMLTLNT